MVFSSHGKVDENNMPNEKAMLQMRQTVAPLLAKYKATAMFAGHDHTYERSEADGVTFITSGGAGAPLRQERTAENRTLTLSLIRPFCTTASSGRRMTPAR